MCQKITFEFISSFFLDSLLLKAFYKIFPYYKRITKLGQNCWYGFTIHSQFKWFTEKNHQTQILMDPQDPHRTFVRCWKERWSHQWMLSWIEMKQVNIPDCSVHLILIMPFFSMFNWKQKMLFSKPVDKQNAPNISFSCPVKPTSNNFKTCVQCPGRTSTSIFKGNWILLGCVTIKHQEYLLVS